MYRGDRVSWQYQGKTTYGVVTSTAGTRATITGPSGGKVSRLGTKEDPVLRIKSESTGNPVLQPRSEVKAAPKRK
uniref:Hypervirulence associated protein TUDOR domain-containing protein n=1 Tax=Bacteriophage sp. TaxID=38018 RepID=A0A7G8LRJ4_9VIRU|nr:MAG: hypothetical protein [Bacteriophage sp.]